MTGAPPAASGPRWFGGRERPLLGLVHAPDGSAGGGAVVLCPPLFSELAASHAAYRALARNLSAAGHWVVRFDYEGTGDSAGPPDGTGRVTAWLDSVDRAVELARSCVDGPVALAGMRMGALLAAVAAQRRTDVDALVVWDPCTSGRAFLRQHQALQALRFPSTEIDGVVELPGYALGAVTAREVGALRLPGQIHARRALVLTRPGRAQPALDLVGSEPPPQPVPAPVVMDRTEPGEQEGLLDVEHLQRRLPAATTARVVRWLDGALRDLLPRPADGAGRPAARRGWSAAGSSAVEMAVEGAPGSAVEERVVSLGRLGLFGIETRPTAGSADLPVVLLLSSGTDSHIGPSRLWVTLARRWAAAGYARCVRVDLSGWGESAPHPGRPERVLRAVEAFDDVAEIVDAVGGPRRVVLAGLCSGAYQALESALELRPAGVLAVNPLLRFTPPELREDGVVSGRRRICEPKRPWIGSVRSKLPHRAGRLVASLRSSLSRLRPSGQAGAWLGELVEADVRVYCVCAEEDAKPLLQTGEHARASWWSSGHVRVDVVPGLDHALLPMAQREVVYERLSEELQRLGDAMRRGSGPGAGRAAVDLA